jgi:hypothetical protein
MAGCETETVAPGNYHWSRDRLFAWMGVGAAGGIVWALANLAGTGPFGWAAAGAVFFAFLAGVALGWFVGYGVEWFSRLKEQDPKTITVHGFIVCAGKNTGVPPFADNDWTFNMAHEAPPIPLRLTFPILAGLDEHEVLTRAAPGSGQSVSYFSTDPNHGGRLVFHCEIGSHIGDYAAAGGAIGSVAGAVAGIAIGIAICVAAGIFTFGIGAALCLLIVAFLAALGAFAGGAAGDLIGAGIGWIADELSDFDKRGEAIHENTCMAFTGTWVTDKSHQHNEIHDIDSAQIIECGEAVGSAASPLGVVAAVGIGRHPTGPDP